MPCAVGWGFQKQKTSCFYSWFLFFNMCFFYKGKRVTGGVKQRDPIVAAVLRFCANRTQSFGARGGFVHIFDLKIKMHLLLLGIRFFRPNGGTKSGSSKKANTMPSPLRTAGNEKSSVFSQPSSSA